MWRWVPAVLALAAVSACGSSAGSPPTGTANVVSPPVQAKANRLAFHSFGIFRRPSKPADAIPVDQAVGGVKPTLSRLAYSGPLGMLFAYLHNGLLCVSYETRVSASAGTGIGRCDAVANARATGIALPIPATFDRIDRLGLFLPDGVKQITITRANGSSTSIPVAGNAVVNSGAGLRGWSFTTPAGMRKSELLRPAPPPKHAVAGPIR